MPTSGPTRDDTDIIGKRIGAHIIDLFIRGLAFFICLLIFTFIAGFLDGVSGGGGTATGDIFALLGFVVGGLVFLAYGFLFETFWNGQTIGKKLLGIKVVKEDGTALDGMSAFIRNIPAPFSLGWIPYLVALVSMASSDTRQRLFDRLAGTVVIKEPATSTNQQPAISHQSRPSHD